MVIQRPPMTSGFDTAFHTDNFKCAFITPAAQYAFGHVTQMKRHNDSDEVFVLLTGGAVLLTKDDNSVGLITTRLLPKVAYNVTCGTWHYLAVTEEAVVFVAESGNMDSKNTESMDISGENIHIDPVR